MRNLIIVCEDSFGLDVKEIVRSINQYWKESHWGTPYKIIGYLGPVHIQNMDVNKQFPYLGSIEKWQPSKDELYAMGIRDPLHKKQAVETLKEKGARFETLWAPWVMAHLDFQFPEGCIIAAQSIMDSAKIGNFVTLYHCMVGFDAVVEDYSSVMAYANITTAHVGKYAQISNNAVIIGKTINNDAVVMPNSVVVKDVKAGITVAGNPARRVNTSKG